MSTSGNTIYTYPLAPHGRPCTFAPYLHTDRLTLEIMDDNHASHISICLSIINDPVSIAAMGDFGIKTFDQYSRLIKSTTVLAKHLPSGTPPTGSFAYLVRLGSQNPEGEIIGVITLASRSDDASVPPDMGWGFFPAHHGKGYATEAARKVLLYVMHELQGGFVNAEPKIPVTAWPDPQNRASVRIAEKLGMVRAGEMTADGGEVCTVYGVPKLLDGRTFTRDTVLSFYGYGEEGVQLRTEVLGLKG